MCSSEFIVGGQKLVILTQHTMLVVKEENNVAEVMFLSKAEKHHKCVN